MKVFDLEICSFSLLFISKTCEVMCGISRGNGFEGAALYFCQMMAATHLPTTLTTHTVQTTTFRMRSHLLFRKEGRRQQKIKKRKITLERLMEKRNSNDRIMCMCAGLSNVAQTGEIKR